MRMQLKHMRLLNFKGIRNQEISFSDNTIIRGRNGAGKSTIYDAFLWVLFGKDSDDRQDFNIKTLDKNGNIIENIPHEVEVVLDVDGLELKLKRQLLEKWTRRRGQKEAVFSGNETVYHWNDAPVTATEYSQKLSEICNEQTFKSVTNPKWFVSQKKDVQRSCLFNFVAVSIEHREKELQNKYEFFKNLCYQQTVEEYKKEVKTKIKSLQNEVHFIPARIEELQRQLIVKDWSSIHSEITKLEQEVEKIETQLESNRAKADDIKAKNELASSEIIELSKELANRKSELTSTLLEEYNSKLYSFRNSISERERRESDIKRIERDITLTSAQRDQLIARKENLLGQWKELKQRTFQVPDNLICPTCKQRLPYDQEQDNVARMKSNFDAETKRLLEENVKAGKMVASDILYQEQVLREMEEKLQALKTIEVSESEEPIKPNVEAIIASDKEVVRIHEALINCQKSIEEVNPDDTELKREKKTLTEKILKLREELVQKEHNVLLNSRIEELRDIQKEQNSQISELEGIDFSIEEYSMERSKLLEEEVNSLFELVQWKLFDKQVNGALVETCVCTINGVPYTDLNTASKINAGLDIIRFISKRDNISMPIFIDNRESVSDIVEMNCQVINLVVDAECETLTIE